MCGGGGGPARIVRRIEKSVVQAVKDPVTVAAFVATGGLSTPTIGASTSGLAAASAKGAHLISTGVATGAVKGVEGQDKTLALDQISPPTREEAEGIIGRRRRRVPRILSSRGFGVVSLENVASRRALGG